MKMRNLLIGMISVAGLAVAANAQPVGDVTFTMNQSANAIAEGGSVDVEIWADMSPDVNGDDVLGYAGSIFDLLNTGGAGLGGITAFEIAPLLAAQSPDPIIGDDDVTGIETFQLPPAFNGDFDASDPILVATFTWTSTGGFGDVGYTQGNRQNMDVYFTALGGSQAWDAIDGVGAWTVVPAPSTLALLGLGGFAATRRRR